MIQLIEVLLFMAILVYLLIILIFHYEDLRNLKKLNCK